MTGQSLLKFSVDELQSRPNNLSYLLRSDGPAPVQLWREPTREGQESNRPHRFLLRISKRYYHITAATGSGWGDGEIVGLAIGERLHGCHRSIGMCGEPNLAIEVEAQAGLFRVSLRRNTTGTPELVPLLLCRFQPSEVEAAMR